jgi:D-3-phosphoglycerate dehydrogenase
MKNNIIIDFDSTFIKTESLDILAKVSKNCSKKCEKKFAEITKMGMNGSISFKDSLEKRIKLLRATKKDIEDTIKIIKTHVSSSFVKNKYFIKKNANCIYIISSGFIEIIRPIVKSFGIKDNNIYANSFKYDLNGNIVGYNKKNSLSKSKGKVSIVKKLKLDGIVHIIGDGFTDYEIKKENYADYFYLYIENIKRESLIKKADFLVKSLDEFIVKLK